MSKQSWRGSTLLNPEPPVLVSCGGLENPNLIEVGQELRVVRPESTAVTRPVAPPSGGADTRPWGLLY